MLILFIRNQFQINKQTSFGKYSQRQHFVFDRGSVQMAVLKRRIFNLFKSCPQIDGSNRFNLKFDSRICFYFVLRFQ